MNIFNCGCTSVDNIEIPTQTDKEEEEVIEESDYTILYNKLFMVSMEFNKMKQGLHTLRIEQTNTERELVELKQKMASVSNDNNTIFDTLLTNAINNGNYRLATRFHYLSLLKKLSQKELIKYDKDKTNTEYQFELKNKELRAKFSYLAYIYDYVWYGEFPVDQLKFGVIENKYKSFIEVI